MKKHFFALCAAVPLVLAACARTGNVTLVMAESNPASSISALVDQAFKEKAEQLSGGSISIQLYTDGALGDNTAVMRQMTAPASAIQLARVSPSALVPYGCRKAVLLELPFTFTSRAHFWRFALSPVADALLDEPYEKRAGVKGLLFAEEGFRHFFSRERIAGTEDFAGAKVRVTNNPALLSIVEGLHAEPVSVTFSNLYSALNTGVADIADQPIANYLANHFNKIAPYMILDGHMLGVTELIITAEAWDALSTQQQQALREAARYAGEYCQRVSQEHEDADLLALQAEGAEFVEVSDFTPWQKACESFVQGAVQDDAALYREIRALAD